MSTDTDYQPNESGPPGPWTCIDPETHHERERFAHPNGWAVVVVHQRFPIRMDDPTDTRVDEGYRARVIDCEKRGTVHAEALCPQCSDRRIAHERAHAFMRQHRAGDIELEERPLHDWREVRQ